MESSAYKTFELEDELSLYINYNGVLTLASESRPDSHSNNLQNNEEEIDTQIKKDFLDDIYGGLDIPESETQEVLYDRIRRYQKIVNRLKLEYNYKCQLCGESFLIDNGNYYCEAHHINMLSNGGSQSPENVLILCANHHRMLHYASKFCFVGELINDKRSIKIETQEFIIQYKKAFFHDQNISEKDI
ncbi:HNH endonuclease [Ruminiclostridium papyrosolvens]|uniref:HNH nuclease domain-containing protein n=1 Tax=Ruminiclostridium papyrosolvens C7 TaxID=1330534 RepID=U4R1W3_9FIRM|nr:HNH endonuclease [Ruminiclostridium papyrosolvens]EPR12045.1 hypothetical protein L323_09840 [Ruminiclostridium papyrosolvens C7]